MKSFADFLQNVTPPGAFKRGYTVIFKLKTTSKVVISDATKIQKVSELQIVMQIIKTLI